MIAQSLENVLQNKQSTVTQNTWTFLAMVKMSQNYNGIQIRKVAPKKELWVVVNSNNQ
jgi:hypothetical protein